MFVMLYDECDICVYVVSEEMDDILFNSYVLCNLFVFLCYIFDKGVVEKVEIIIL